MWIRFPDPNDRGVAGDSFGGITALFSGLAFSGLIITLVMQRRELELQRIELSETRKVMKDQLNYIEKQNFESTYFKLVENFYSIVDSIDYDCFKKENSHQKNPSVNKDYERYTGRDALLFFCESLFETTAQISLSNFDSMNLIERDLHAKFAEIEWEKRYLLAHEEYESDLGIYFRNLYSVIKYVDDNTELSIEEKYKYIKIIRSSLTSRECILIFMNGTTKLAREKMKPLIEKYGLIKHTPIKARLAVPFIRNQYNDKAFGETSDSKEPYYNMNTLGEFT